MVHLYLTPASKPYAQKDMLEEGYLIGSAPGGKDEPAWLFPLF